MVAANAMWNEGNVVNLERLISRAIDHFVIQWGDCNLHNPFFGVTSNWVWKNIQCCKYPYRFDKMLIGGGQFGKTCDDLQTLAKWHNIRLYQHCARIFQRFFWSWRCSTRLQWISLKCWGLWRRMVSDHNLKFVEVWCGLSMYR